MTRVIIETNAGVAFTKQAVKDSLGRGEFPLSMQLLYTTPGFSPEEGALGENAIFGVERSCRTGCLLYRYRHLARDAGTA